MKRIRMHNFESTVILCCTVHKISNMLVKTPFVSKSNYNDKIFVNIQQELSQIFRLCLRNKDLFAEDNLHKSYCFAYFKFVSVFCDYFTSKFMGVYFSHTYVA